MSGETLAIIPVRGGSVGIPRKNARLLRGKPLLAYVIEAARHSEEIATVVVSTEDPELAEIARRFGAEVVERPDELAGPEVTLDDVIAELRGGRRGRARVLFRSRDQRGTPIGWQKQNRSMRRIGIE